MENDVKQQRIDFWKNNDNIEQLKNCPAEKLYEYFINNYPRQENEASKADWISFKKYLKQNCNIEYVSKSKQEEQQILNKNNAIIKNATNKLVLNINANYKSNRFLITDKDCQAIWYGQENFKFEKDESKKQFENSWEANYNCAKKALWVANQIKTANNLDNLVVVLKTDCEPLTYQNKITNKSFGLSKKANEYNLGLIIENNLDKEKNKIAMDKFLNFDKKEAYENLLEQNDYKFKTIENNQLDIELEKENQIQNDLGDLDETETKEEKIIEIRRER